MLYGKVSDGFTNLITEDKLREQLSDTNLPAVLTAANLASFGYTPLEAPQATEFVPHTADKIYTYYVVEEEGVYVRKPTLVDYQGDVDARISRRWDSLRERRNELLDESDGQIQSDRVLQKGEWEEYRQQLRDLTDQSTDPFLISLPNKPRDGKGTDVQTARNYYINKSIARRDKALKTKWLVETALGFAITCSAECLGILHTTLLAGGDVVRAADGTTKPIDELELLDLIALVASMQHQLHVKHWEELDQLETANTRTQLSQMDGLF